MAEIQKQSAVQQFINLAKDHTKENVTRERLDHVLEGLKDLASQTDWWSEAHYAGPVEGELQARHLIHEDSDGTYALYLNVMKPGKKIVPHNHTTWACIAAVEGTETNYLYERTDGGTQAGYAILKEVGVKRVGPGEGVALLADDIHAVHINDDTIRHLHMYGLSLEQLDERLAFDIEAQNCAVMPIGVKTQR